MTESRMSFRDWFRGILAERDLPLGEAARLLGSLQRPCEAGGRVRHSPRIHHDPLARYFYHAVVTLRRASDVSDHPTVPVQVAATSSLARRDQGHTTPLTCTPRKLLINSPLLADTIRAPRVPL